MAKDQKNESQSQEQQVDIVDESAEKVVHLADLGTSLTSHGDGSATIAPDYIKRREELAKINADADRDNRALARKLGRDV